MASVVRRRYEQRWGNAVRDERADFRRVRRRPAVGRVGIRGGGVRVGRILGVGSHPVERGSRWRTATAGRGPDRGPGLDRGRDVTGPAWTHGDAPGPAPALEGGARADHSRRALERPADAGCRAGWPPGLEFGDFGEESDARVRAAKLDEGLDVLAGLWTGQRFDYAGTHHRLSRVEMLPRPVQSRVPIWVGASGRIIERRSDGPPDSTAFIRCCSRCHRTSNRRRSATWFAISASSSR